MSNIRCALDTVMKQEEEGLYNKNTYEEFKKEK